MSMIPRLPYLTENYGSYNQKIQKNPKWEANWDCSIKADDEPMVKAQNIGQFYR